MNPSRNNLLIGILLGFLLMGIGVYLRSVIISKELPIFLIGFLTCLALMSGLFIIVGIWFRQQLTEYFFGKAETNSKPNDAFKNSLERLAQRYLPNSPQQEIQSSIRFVQTFVWGRMVYTFGRISKCRFFN